MSGQMANGRSQSLYRKYRPATFAEDVFVGQNHVSRTLRNAVRHDRVAHAYLFCGPRGSGKTSSARLLAKAVNCEAENPNDRPCNECTSCRAINDGRAVDIIEIDAASNRGVDDIRDLREKVKFAPAQLRKKFYIIDEVHQLTKDASNALLKTLEEPPPHVIFVLATTDQEKVLDTISSRCQTFVFHRFPTEVIIAHLRRICTSEGIRADDAALAAIARAATGAMRDALGLLDQLSAYGDSEEGITADTVRQVLGAGGGEQVLALVDAIAAGDAAAGLRVINAVIDDGADARQFASQVVEYLRALLHAAATPARGARESAAETPVAPEHLEAFTLGEIAALVKRFSQVDYGIRHSVYGHLPLELCLIDCILVRTGAATSAPVEAAARPAPAAPRPLPNRAAPRPGGIEPPQPERAAPPPPDRLPTPIRPEAVVPPRPVPANPAPQAESPRPEVPAARAPEPPAAPPESPRPLAAVPTPPAQSAPPPAPAAAPAPVPAVPVLPDLSIEQIQDLWPRIRQGVRAINRRIEALLASTDPYMIADGTLTLVAAYDFHRNGLNKDDAKRAVEEVLAQVLGGPYSLVCITQDEVKAMPAPAPRPVRDDAPAAPPAPIVAVKSPPPPPPDLPPDEPPWDFDAPAPGFDPEPQRSAPDPAPRPQARLDNGAGTSDGPPRALVATADERYITAVRNIFNAVEIQTDGAVPSRKAWGD